MGIVVTFNGNNYAAAQADATRFMENGGFRTWLFTMFSDMLTELDTRRNQVGLPLTATSTTSLTLASTGSITFTASTGKGFVAGTRVRLSNSADPANFYMEGVTTAYNSTTGSMTVALNNSLGSGSFNSWNINLAGDVGAAGPTGSQANIVIESKSGSFSPVLADRGKFFKCSGSFTASLSPTTLTTGWWAVFYNSSTGTISLSPTSGTINGELTWEVKQGQSIWLHSDGTNFYIGSAAFDVENITTQSEFDLNDLILIYDDSADAMKGAKFSDIINYLRTQL